MALRFGQRIGHFGEKGKPIALLSGEKPALLKKANICEKGLLIILLLGQKRGLLKMENFTKKVGLEPSFLVKMRFLQQQPILVKR